MLFVRSLFWNDSTVQAVLHNTFNGCGGDLRVEHISSATKLWFIKLMPIVTPVCGDGGEGGGW